MPILYTDGNPTTLAYVIDGGGTSGYQYIPADTYSSMEAEYLAIIYGLNEYFLRWNKELDERHEEMNIESYAKTGDPEFYKVPKPSVFTPRPLPAAVLVRCDNDVVVNQLRRNYHIKDKRLRKLAHQVWQMCENVDVKFEWISRKENLAGKMLK
jgi:ribonuclease HI